LGLLFFSRLCAAVAAAHDSSGLLRQVAITEAWRASRIRRRVAGALGVSLDVVRLLRINGAGCF